MPAGDALTADGQFELAGVVYGFGCTWENDVPGWTLLGLPVTNHDVDFSLEAGGVSTLDTDGKRVCAFPIFTTTATAGEAFIAAFELEEAWRAGDDVELHFQLQGVGHRFLVGRTRGAVIDMRDAHQGLVRALCNFTAADPTITAVEDEGS